MYIKRSLKRGYSTKDLGISAFKAFRIKLKDGYKNFKDSFEKEHIGKAFDEGYEKIRTKVSDMVSNLYKVNICRFTIWKRSQDISF